MLNLFEKAKKIFLSAEDQQALADQAEYVRKLQAVRKLMDSEGGEVLKAWIKEDLTATVKELNEATAANPERETLLARVKVYFELLNKLNVQPELEAIEQWLEDKLAE